MPQSMDDSRFENIVCSLQELVKEYRGPVIIKKPINQIYEEFEECDLVDQITFAGALLCFNNLIYFFIIIF
jgi:hypothetical protein